MSFSISIDALAETSQSLPKASFAFPGPVTCYSSVTGKLEAVPDSRAGRSGGSDGRGAESVSSGSERSYSRGKQQMLDKWRLDHRPTAFTSEV